MKLMLLPLCLLIASLTSLTAHVKAPKDLGFENKGQIEAFIDGVRGFSYYYGYAEAISKAPKAEGEMKSVVEAAKRLVKENENFKTNLDDLIASHPKKKHFFKILSEITHWKSKAGFDKGTNDLNAGNTQKIMNQLKIAEGEIEAFGFIGLSNVAKKYQFVINNAKSKDGSHNNHEKKDRK